jgi:putative N6-adenine-specific DNA methylase
MCGSGTPAIEAALIALNRAPGSFKSHFGFMALKGYRITIPGESAGTSVRQRFGASPEQIWKEMVAAARGQERKEGLPPILATDIDPEAVETARLNAIAAGVSEHITFATCDFAATRLPPPPGVIFLNPEYGERMGEEQDLEPLYGRIGDFFKQKCAGYTGCVLTGNMEMSRKIGLRSSQRIPFFNGPIECRLVVFELYEGSLRDGGGESDE